MITEFKRVKFGQQPGDYSKRTKIRLLEHNPLSTDTNLSSIEHVKSFKRDIRDKSRTVQRRRDKKACLADH